jgi:hypothetical protein
VSGSELHRAELRFGSPTRARTTIQGVFLRDDLVKRCFEVKTSRVRSPVRPVNSLKSGLGICFSYNSRERVRR